MALFGSLPYMTDHKALVNRVGMLTTWVWQQADWPQFTWDEAVVLPLLRQVQLKQGILLGKAGAFDVADDKTALDTLLQNIITSSAIEGESLNVQSVRSSLAKRLGVSVEGDNLNYPTSAQTEGLAELMMDAIQNVKQPLSLERLYQWHAWLFPEQEFTFHRVRVGQLRGDEPMQVVSGRIDRPKVHFEAPPRDRLEQQLMEFINWFNQSRNDTTVAPLLRAGVCHFWFVTLHPFDDGNGRLTRALTDLALAQADAQSIRLYAMSVAILDKRNSYYTILETCQRGNLNITPWLKWFLDTLEETLQAAMDKIDRTLNKTRFWHRFNDAALSKEQIKVLNRLLDGGEKGFEHGISASQYQKVAKVSKATATRHLADLVKKGCLVKLPGGGRSTRYQVSVSD